MLLPTQHVPSRKVPSHKQLKIAKWSHRSVAKNTETSLVTNAVSSGLLFTHQRKASENTELFHFQNHFSFQVLPFPIGTELTSSHIGTILFRRKHQGMRQEYSASPMGCWLCQHLPITQGCPVLSLHQEQRKTPHPEMWGVSSGERNPVQTQGGCSSFDQKPDAAWRPDAVLAQGYSLAFQTYLGQGVKLLQGCKIREVPPEKQHLGSHCWWRGLSAEPMLAWVCCLASAWHLQGSSSQSVFSQL